MVILMTSRLQGIELLNCANADLHQNMSEAAQRCGYGKDLVEFEEGLKEAARAIGIEIDGFDGLIAISSRASLRGEGIEVAPDSRGQI
jgi:hypothetical protein